ncbi:hypothetical protein RB620_24515 [Paenibacillus sp. LHD-117]|uniref:hypothetical protein n=1 Tax=Paenibacillus sp. LHD-117 TaxID=3071412 RepID=UPI0027E1AC0C|nr:hypothetical protein [Paenibacillus sp. LHD-117]MDQ6422600.1 hypothetical protein [Paenibacillus sp. LHD-117]
MMKFNCRNGKEEWQGEIRSNKNYGSHYYLNISAKGSGISLYFGAAAFGQWFVCVPDWNAGVIIGDLRDQHYNVEKIGAAMENESDGISIAEALRVFAEANEIQEVDSSEEIFAVMKAAGFTSSIEDFQNDLQKKSDEDKSDK